MYLRILQIGVYVSLFFVFFVFKNLLFPYITSKQIPFNILMEVLFVIWTAFVIKYPNYRPKKSFVTFGMMAYFGVMLVSTFMGVDFNLSMWGDVERMLGAFHILHFFVLYLIIITVFTKKIDWLILFTVSFAVSSLLSLDVLGASSGYGSIGNVAYVAGYLIFNIYFGALLFLHTKNTALRFLYFFVIALMTYVLYATNVAGAYVGLSLGFVFAVFLYMVLGKNVKYRIMAIASSVILLFLVIGFFSLNKDSGLIKSNNFLYKVRSEISFSKATFQTRLISWRGGIKDLKNHPLLGVGHGNYAYIFDKYFDPTFYDYTRGETYFDRAHNNIIDIVSTTGILGLLTYLSIFVAIAYYLIRGYRKDYINLREFVILASLFTAYFIQNLAVFDSFPTYQMLMISLGYVYWLNKKGEDEEKGAAEVAGDTEFDNKEIYALLIAGIVMLTIAYQYNIKPWKMLIGTIEGQKVAKNPELLIAEYKRALSYDTVLDRDSRTSLIRMFSDAGSVNNLPDDKKKEYMDYVIGLAEKNVAYNTHDSLNQMALAQVLNAASSMYQPGSEGFMHYSSRALAAIDKSIEASPKRVPIYYQKAQIQMTMGRVDEALDTLRYAYDLHPSYYDSACHLGKTLIYLKKEAEGYKYLDECVQSEGGADLLGPSGYVKGLIDRYVNKKDIDSVIKLSKRIAMLAPTPENWVNLAKLYAQKGDKENAVAAVAEAIKLDPRIEEYAKEFLDKLK